MSHKENIVDACWVTNSFTKHCLDCDKSPIPFLLAYSRHIQYCLPQGPCGICINFSILCTMLIWSDALKKGTFLIISLYVCWLINYAFPYRVRNSGFVWFWLIVPMSSVSSSRMTQKVREHEWATYLFFFFISSCVYMKRMAKICSFSENWEADPIYVWEGIYPIVSTHHGRKEQTTQDFPWAPGHTNPESITPHECLQGRF